MIKVFVRLVCRQIVLSSNERHIRWVFYFTFTQVFSLSVPSRLGFGRIFSYYSFIFSPPVPSLVIVLYLLLSCLQPVGAFYSHASV